MRHLFPYLLFCAVVLGVDSPEWVRRGKPQGGGYKYYIGRSSSAPSEQAGFAEATREAYEQAIRENFGFQTKIQTDAYESTRTVVSTKRVKVLSQDIRVLGFEQVEFFTQEKVDRRDIWVLYRYPLVEIEREKSRLAGARAEKEDLLSEQGTRENGLKSGILEIKTFPAGATVLIDGESYGVAPIRLLGVLPPGRHAIRLDHPNYLTLDETVILVPGRTTEIYKNLVPATARLSITTEPSQANILMNGRFIGATPLMGLEVPVHQDLKVEITHPEASPLSVRLQVAKDDYSAKHFDLPLKNASLTVRSVPRGAEVWIDGQRAGATPVGPKTLSGGKHRVLIRKQGFQEQSKTIVLRGGEKRILGDVRLEVRRVGAEPALWRELSGG